MRVIPHEAKVLLKVTVIDRTYESYCDLSRQYDPNPSPKKLDDGTEVPAYDGPGVDTFVQDFGRDDLLSYSTFVV